ncbi:MAG: MFS transporter [Alphaproteobacteria bacterium]|nr:MFS transporter [Alphaproteobacteria bacterium]
MHKLILQIKRMPEGLWSVSIANMLIAISTTMTFSISPFYLTTVLGISLLGMGVMEGFTEGLSQISKLFSGISSDVSKKKKPTLLFGVFLAVLSKPFFILASGVGAIMTSKILERVSNGVIATPRDAYVADISTKENRGSAFGVMMTGKTVGCIIGPFLVSFLMFFTEDLRTLLWLGFFPSILAVIIIWKVMPEKKEVPLNTSTQRVALQDHAPRGDKSKRFSLNDIMNMPYAYWSLLIVSSLFMVARFNDGYLSLRLAELGAPKSLCVATIGIFNAISALCCFPIGKLSDRINRSTLLYFSYISLFLSNVCFIFAEDMWLGLVGVIFWGAQRGTSQILFSAIIADEAPKHIMGTAIGLFYIVGGVISLGAGSVAGYISNNSLSGIFYFGAITSFIALAFLAFRNNSANARARVDALTSEFTQRSESNAEA